MLSGSNLPTFWKRPWAPYLKQKRCSDLVNLEFRVRYISFLAWKELGKVN